MTVRPLLPVRGHLRPRPQRFQPPSWQPCCRVAAAMGVEPEMLWPALNSVSVHIRDPLKGWIVSDMPPDLAASPPP